MPRTIRAYLKKARGVTNQGRSIDGPNRINSDQVLNKTNVCRTYYRSVDQLVLCIAHRIVPKKQIGPAANHGHSVEKSEHSCCTQAITRDHGYLDPSYIFQYFYYCGEDLLLIKIGKNIVFCMYRAQKKECTRKYPIRAYTR